MTPILPPGLRRITIHVEFHTDLNDAELARLHIIEIPLPGPQHFTQLWADGMERVISRVRLAGYADGRICSVRATELPRVDAPLPDKARTTISCTVVGDGYIRSPCLKPLLYAQRRGDMVSAKSIMERPTPAPAHWRRIRLIIEVETDRTILDAALLYRMEFAPLNEDCMTTLGDQARAHAILTSKQFLVDNDTIDMVEAVDTALSQPA